MAQNIQTNLVQPVATPPQNVPSLARVLRAQAVHRLQIGLFGLAAMLLLVGLANIIMDRARLADDANASPDAAASVGAKAASDPLYPDLAFSLPRTLTEPPEAPRGSQPTVAVGIYAVESSPEKRREYIETVGGFLVWLLDHGYRARVVIGDVKYDTSTLNELRAWLASRGVLDRIVDEPVASFEDLLKQLAEADMVVATRFHNVLLSILLGKPVVSISHMDKNDALMEQMGLSEYCRGLSDVGTEQVVALFQALERNAPRVRAQIDDRLERFRLKLEEQYSIIFGELAGKTA